MIAIHDSFERERLHDYVRFTKTTRWLLHQLNTALTMMEGTILADVLMDSEKTKTTPQS